MKRLLAFGIGAVISAVIIWFVRRTLAQSGTQNAAPAMQSVAPMTAPVATVPTPQSNGSNPNGTPVSMTSNASSAQTSKSSAPATDEPKAAEETVPATQTTRAESDSDLAVPQTQVVDAPTKAEKETEDTTEGDDLTVIKGIGKVVNQKLYDAGIRTFQQLADASIEELEEKAGIPEWRIKTDLIQEQAAELARGEHHLFTSEPESDEAGAQAQESGSAAES